ncbi:ankyrin repeat-containing protein ITN1-like [Nicotiana sylvestris]|uniref:ankyrin repeat-containing protein ITN1-like n=1 Tax=Nicotiana sylvestris TaxID=4096 RepID=UPI00388CAE03
MKRKEVEFGKRIDPTGKKKYVKQVTGRHNDTELHLAAQRRDVGAVREILEEIDAQMLKTLSGAEFDAEVAAIREAMVNEVNELGETALFTAAERGYIDVVKELLPYSTKEGIALVLIPCILLLAKVTKGSFGTMPQKDIHQLSMNCFPSQISRSNGKNALHLSARQGHVDIVKALLEKDPQLARRTDEKGQTALHMTVKGVSSEVVKLLLQADPAIVMLPDKFGNTALHIATRKKRSEVSVVALLSASCFPWLWKQWRI